MCFLFSDRLILGYKSFHNSPANEVGNGAVAEDNHVASRFACGTEELEVRALFICVCEEHTRTPVDSEGAKTAKHGTDACNSGDS